MTDENQNPKDVKKEELPPLPPPITSPEVNEETNSSSSTDNPSEETKPGFNLPQPFIVKEQKEKTRWLLKKSESISFIALLISAYAVTLNKCSLDNTKRALAITDSTFKQNRIKDSVAQIERLKNYFSDSIQREYGRLKDSINISITKQGLDAQIKSIGEERKMFQIENRGFIHISDISFDTTMTSTPFVISYEAHNAGKLPIVVSYRKVGVGLDLGNQHPDFFRNDLDKKNRWQIAQGNDIISGQSKIVYKQITNETIDPSVSELFRNGKLAIFLTIEVHYDCLSINKSFKSLYTFRIRKDVRSGFINFTSLEYWDKEK